MRSMAASDPRPVTVSCASRLNPVARLVLRAMGAGSTGLSMLLAASVAAHAQPAMFPQDSDAPAQGAVKSAPEEGQDAEPGREAAEVRKDPEAALAVIRAMIAAYRSEKSVRTTTTVRVMARQDGEEGAGPVVEAKFAFGAKRQGVMSFRGYELRIGGGKILATHESSPLAYLEVDDDGSPYYQIFNAFQALPFPELALGFGEDDPGEVCMQLIPSIPNVVPIGVGDDEIEGQAMRFVLLESDDSTEELRLYFDPETYFLEAARGVLRNTDQVPEGAELVWKVESVSVRPKEPLGEKDFTLDLGGRQKVDGLAALINQDRRAVEEGESDRDVEALKVGEPAPELVLPRTAAEGDWSLAAEQPKPVVVDFFATWCGPCVGAFPEIAALAREFEGRATVMLVNTGEQGSRQEREKRIEEVMQKRKVRLQSVLDLDGSASRRWLVRAFPTTFLIGTDGKIAGVWVGSSPRSQKELREKLEALCGKPNPPGAEAGAEAKPEAEPKAEGKSKPKPPQSPAAGA